MCPPPSDPGTNSPPDEEGSPCALPSAEPKAGDYGGQAAEKPPVASVATEPTATRSESKQLTTCIKGLENEHNHTYGRT